MNVLSSWVERAAAPAQSESQERQADAAECADIAAALGIVGCRNFNARYTISELGRGRYQVAGTFAAVLVQTCVVTLDPFDQTVEEPFEFEFWPAEQLAPDPGASATGREIEIDGLSGEDPEPIINGRLEIGPVLYQLLAAATDPFPRGPEAELERTEAGDPDRERSKHPFAALRRLKPDDEAPPDAD